MSKYVIITEQDIENGDGGEIYDGTEREMKDYVKNELADNVWLTEDGESLDVYIIRLDKPNFILTVDKQIKIQEV